VITPTAADTVPSKCAGPTGPGIEPNPCTEPGGLPRCQLCPNSPTYWRKAT
jgi:hypothetical protein